MNAKPPLGVRTIAAGEFKARCLELMDQVAATGETIVITKRGKPVARLVQPERERPSLFGFAKGYIESVGDIVSPIGEPWDPGDLSLFDTTLPPKKATRRRSEAVPSSKRAAASKGAPAPKATPKRRAG